MFKTIKDEGVEMSGEDAESKSEDSNCNSELAGRNPGYNP